MILILVQAKVLYTFLLLLVCDSVCIDMVILLSGFVATFSPNVIRYGL